MEKGSPFGAALLLNTGTMRIIILFLFFLLFTLTSSAQRLVRAMVMPDVTQLPYAYMDLSQAIPVDTTRIVIEYDFTYIPNIASGSKRSDILILQVGRNTTKCFGEKRFFKNRQYTRLIHDINVADSVREKQPTGDGSIGYEIFFDNKKNALTYYHQYPGWFSKRIMYEEIMQPTDWHIETQCDSLFGYSCFRATGQFGGRIWYVVFTTDIAVNGGPWKLNGLPGVILHAEDAAKNFCFKCIAIKPTDEPIYMYEIPTEKVSKNKWLRMERAMHESPYFYFTDGGRIKISSKGGDLDSSWVIPYNPIELE